MAHSPYTLPLGVAAALPDSDHANTYLAVVRGGRYWLVDCADGPIGRLQRAGLDPLNVQGVILTHFHPDHVYGLPAYVLGLFLLALEVDDHVWTRPVPIYARPEVLERVRALLALFADQEWFNTLPLTYHEVAPEVGARVAEDDDFVITAAPGEHSVPSLALRFAARGLDRTFVYSSDTQLSAVVETLASGADLLFHEATGSGQGHTSAMAAGELAARAGVAQLGLIHYDPRVAPETLLAPVRRAFEGPVFLAQELRRYPW